MSTNAWMRSGKQSSSFIEMKNLILDSSILESHLSATMLLPPASRETFPQDLRLRFGEGSSAPLSGTVGLMWQGEGPGQIAMAMSPAQKSEAIRQPKGCFVAGCTMQVFAGWSSDGMCESHDNSGIVAEVPVSVRRVDWRQWGLLALPRDMNDTVRLKQLQASRAENQVESGSFGELLALSGPAELGRSGRWMKWDILTI
ncbi:hypothetical protein V8F06_010820 [Rhypophila decipiens]